MSARDVEPWCYDYPACLADGEPCQACEEATTAHNVVAGQEQAAQIAGQLLSDVDGGWS